MRPIKLLHLPPRNHTTTLFSGVFKTSTNHNGRRYKLTQVGETRNVSVEHARIERAVVLLDYCHYHDYRFTTRNRGEMAASAPVSQSVETLINWHRRRFSSHAKSQNEYPEENLCHLLTVEFVSLVPPIAPRVSYKSQELYSFPPQHIRVFGMKQTTPI